MEEYIEIIIEKPRSKSDEKYPIEKHIQWFDVFYRKMRVFQCTKLDFKYTKELFVQFPDGVKKPLGETTKQEQDQHGVSFKNMLRPEPVTFYKKSSDTTTDDKVIKKFLETYDRYNTTGASIISETDDSIVVSIPEREEREFTDELYRNRLEYEVS